MTGSRGSHGEAPTSRRATQADGILLATPKQQNDPGDWRSRGQLEPATPSTSPSYWSDDDTEPGVKPTDLYGKFTWKIENFSEISKRELRSNVFEVGNFKWYILVYPHGCDVCNHLSLFLCVADYDKLLPGWSHFAQFTIAVVNKDPKKSKYSDTLHRFCKKEHDWGWKKFMELSKVMDGFTVADTLVIKAQVQVIKEAVGRPFRCLDSQYRRELVRVYLTNVEGICRRFVEEKREKLSKLVEDDIRFASFRAFWAGIKESQRKGLSCEKAETILKSVVKKFFNEKEVTSTLVMDALFSGTKSLERGYKVRPGQEEWPQAIAFIEKDYFILNGDVLSVLDKAVHEPIPAYKDDKGSGGTPHRIKESGLDDMGRDSVERDERRLQELGRRTVEMFVLHHLFSNRVEVAYREAVALKRQEELIREEEEAEKQAAERVEKETADKEKKQSKKQKAKQRKKDRLQKEEDQKRARLELEQRTKKEKENVRKVAQMSAAPAPLEETETDEESDVDDEEEELSEEEEEEEELEAEALEGEEEEEEELEAEALEEEESGEVEDEKPGPAHIEEEEEDEWQEAEPAFRAAVTAYAPAVTVSKRRRRNKKKRGVESNEVVGGAGPILPLPPAKVADDASSTASGESAKGTTNGAAGPLDFVEKQDLEKQVEKQEKPSAPNGDVDVLEIEERVASAGAAGVPSSSGAEEYDSHEAEAIIASLRERVAWLEDRLKEKEDEVIVLQQQLRQQALPNGAATPARPSSALSHSSSEVVSRPTTAQKSQPNGPSSRGFSQQTGNRVLVRSGGERPVTPVSAREDPPSAASAAQAAAAAALSRPTSAPGAGQLLRHISGPVPAVANPTVEATQLARSLSGSTSGGKPNEVSATPLAPSYRNAAAGKIRGGPSPTLPTAPQSSAPLPTSMAAFPPIGQPPQIVTQQGGSSRSSSSQASPPLTPSSQQESPSSGPATPSKSAPGQEQAAAKEQASPEGLPPGTKRGAVYAPPLNLERAPTGSGSEAEEAKGITFGSVTADVLPPRSPRGGVPEQQAQSRGVQQQHRTPPPAGRSSAAPGQPNMDSPGLSEDFPHLSLINDLLDDDLLGIGGVVANGNPQGGYNPAHSRTPPQLLARKLHPGASPFSPASAANHADAERAGTSNSQGNGLSHQPQNAQQQAHYQGGNHAAGGHKNGPPKYAPQGGGMQRAQQLRHTRSLPPGAADGLLSNGHMGHPQMYWIPNSGAYPPPGMHGANGGMHGVQNGSILEKTGVPPGYQMAHGNYGQYAQAQQQLPPQHQ